jgi:hypothetical protein
VSPAQFHMLLSPPLGSPGACFVLPVPGSKPGQCPCLTEGLAAADQPCKKWMLPLLSTVHHQCFILASLGQK